LDKEDLFDNAKIELFKVVESNPHEALIIDNNFDIICVNSVLSSKLFYHNDTIGNSNIRSIVSPKSCKDVCNSISNLFVLAESDRNATQILEDIHI